MSTYLSADELADLVGCKSNQRTKMATWLKNSGCRHEIDANGMPKVARAYHDRKMGISDGSARSKLTDEPNREAFKQQRLVGKSGAV